MVRVDIIGDREGTTICTFSTLLGTEPEGKTYAPHGRLVSPAGPPTVKASQVAPPPNEGYFRDRTPSSTIALAPKRKSRVSHTICLPAAVQIFSSLRPTDLCADVREPARRAISVSDVGRDVFCHASSKDEVSVGRSSVPPKIVSSLMATADFYGRISVLAATGVTAAMGRLACQGTRAISSVTKRV